MQENRVRHPFACSGASACASAQAIRSSSITATLDITCFPPREDETMRSVLVDCFCRWPRHMASTHCGSPAIPTMLHRERRARGWEPFSKASSRSRQMIRSICAASIRNADTDSISRQSNRFDRSGIAYRDASQWRTLVTGRDVAMFVNSRRHRLPHAKVQTMCPGNAHD